MSIKLAADELLVTPGAVSHQIKSLERSLGTQLFVRSNNAIELTDAGVRLAQKALPGLQLLHASLGDVIRNTNVLRVRASMSFAVRWLIPKLYLFKAKNPDANIEVETFFDDARQLSGSADVTIGYYREGERPTGVRDLFDDVCRPYLSPVLLSILADPCDLVTIPAIQCAKGNWDWHLWMEKSGMHDVDLQFADRFDSDDAALRAACVGLGMILSSSFMVETELSDGRLVPLPECAEFNAGCYTLQVGEHETNLTRRFVRWLQEIAKSRH
ncbi:LysR substrate-binding domain-containing protein [Ruegeria sp. 2012CJ41-6]|uniref:LysR substrate-binding domain-containing protein n=2 Tax=Ruegeria spongiae TaxID=2942209 RepID=A0ABT0Q201_9RHOB|nr:LysR substrate-binding domain-containing protein [Ruegeria spongiae]